MGALSRLGLDPGANAAPHTDQASATQSQTGSAFGYQWGRRDTYDSPAMREMMRQWLVDRYCAGDPEALGRLLGDDGKIILDAGCGAGLSAGVLFGDLLKRHDYLGVDISDAMVVARQRFAEMGLPADFLKCDLMKLPLPTQSVDMIFSEGVLHHTDDTGAALAYLSGFLKPGGHFLFYVYAKKAVIREFTDDYVRQQLAGLTDEEAWEALKPLTKLGQKLGELGVELEVPEDIPFLGIQKGVYDLQRFVYWNIIKAFHRTDFSLDEMNHINFDWFRPLNCHRHTEAEVRHFCQAAGLEVLRLTVEEAGITVVAQKLTS